MTALLEPDIGEVLDRQAILQLKIDAGMRKGVSTLVWENEYANLDSYLTRKMQSWQRTATAAAAENFGRLNAELVIINMKLWSAEDELRIHKPTNGDSALGDKAEVLAEVALRIADLNDLRSNTVRAINSLFGVETGAKIYA